MSFEEALMNASFYIVESGFQIMPPAHYSAWQIVTDDNAIKVDDKVYCTEKWLEIMTKPSVT